MQRIIVLIISYSLQACSGYSKFSNLPLMCADPTSIDFSDKIPVKTKVSFQSKAAQGWNISRERFLSDDNSEINLTILPNGDAKRQGRIRQQYNIYYLEPRPSQIKFGFGFFFQKNNQFLTDPDVEFEWLTIAEVWNDPGWIRSEYPFRITVTVVKELSELSSRISIRGDSKTFGTGKWKNEWVENLIHPIIPEKFYHLELFLEPKKKLLKVSFREKGRYKFERKYVHYLSHPKQVSPKGIWGINPVKLYTGSAVVEGFSNEQVALKVLNPYLCFNEQVNN